MSICRFPLPKLELCGQWKVQGQGDRKKTSLMALPVETRKLGLKVGEPIGASKNHIFV